MFMVFVIAIPQKHDIRQVKTFVTRNMLWLKCTRTVFSALRLTTTRNLSGAGSPTAATVSYERDGNLAIITLCHPAARNAIDAHMTERLAEAFDRFEADPDVRVGVLCGSGGTFSAGTDMKSADLVQNLADARTTGVARPGGGRTHFAKPMVCGIGGYCVGSGLELALLCDLRVVEEEACLGFFNRRYGVPLTEAATAPRLATLIGLSRSLDLLLTGRVLGGKEALELGLANRLVATGTALGQAVTLAKSIAKYPQASLLFDREALLRSAHAVSASDAGEPFNDAIRAEMRQGIEVFKTSRGRAGKTQNTRRLEMADWELAEYNIEVQNQSK